MYIRRSMGVALAVIGFLAIVPAASAQDNRITAFPAEFDQMVMYGDYRRGSGGTGLRAARDHRDR